MDPFHQIHHSPQRLEVITSFYKHPLEMTVNSIIGSLLVYNFLGLNMEAGAIYTLCTARGEFFYHQCKNAAMGRVYIPEARNASHSSRIRKAITMGILFGGICCLAHMKTRKNLIVLADLIQKKS